MEHLQSFIQDCDRKTELAKRRLKETQEELSEEANTKVNVINKVKQTKNKAEESCFCIYKRQKSTFYV